MNVGLMRVNVGLRWLIVVGCGRWWMNVVDGG